MEANQKSSPVSAAELKAVIYQKIGRQRTEDYFDLLKRFLSLRLDKYEFDESCKRIIGRDNLSLHNQLIRTILKNSCAGRVPLPRAKNVAVAASPNVKVANGLPVHSRSLVNRGREFCDPPSPLGPLGKSQQSEKELLSLASRLPIEVVSMEDGEEVEQAAGSPSIQRSPVTALLGVPMYEGAHKALSSGTQQKYHSLACQQTRELPDARSLMILLEQKLETEGLKISVDCANVLNNGLDCYLKRLIEPCIGLAGSRCMKERPQHITGQRVITSNGMLPASGIVWPKPSNSTYASVSDFGAVMMESNPGILGGDWAVLHEKVCAQAFKE